MLQIYHEATVRNELASCPLAFPHQPEDPRKGTLKFQIHELCLRASGEECFCPVNTTPKQDQALPTLGGGVLGLPGAMA